MKFCWIVIRSSGTSEPLERIAAPPLDTVHVQGLNKLRYHMKRVHAMPNCPAQNYSGQAIITSAFTELRLEFSIVASQKQP